MAQGVRRDMGQLLERQNDMPGRPTKLTRGRHERIVKNIAAAGKFGLAARAAGVGKSTASLWMARGIKYAEHLMMGGEPIPTETRYLEFANDVAKAESMYEISVIGLIREIGSPHEVETTKVVEKIDADGNTSVVTETSKRRVDNWQALAWLLERLNPEVYARVMRTEHSGPNGEPMQVESVGVSYVEVHEERDARIEKILAALADTRGGPRAAEIALTRGSASGEDVIDAASHEVHAPHTNGSSNGVSPS